MSDIKFCQTANNALSLWNNLDIMAATKPFFSIIIPVYNRPDEVRELLESLDAQTCKDFELLLVEDGSTRRCDEVAREYADRMTIRYFYKENSGRSLTRNYGMERFLERVTLSKYKDNFILKGGMLVAAMVGLDNRATMDIDTSIRNLPLDT